MLAAVRCFQRTDPLSNFVVLQRRNSLEISAHNGGQVHRRGVVADLFHRCRQMRYRVILQWNRSMARGSSRDYIRSEEHTSELQSHRDLHSFPTRRSSDLSDVSSERIHFPISSSCSGAIPSKYLRTMVVRCTGAV